MKYFTLLVFIFMSNHICLSNIVEIDTWIRPSSMPDIKNDQFIFVDFWATWCGPCIKAMDHLGELKKTTGDAVVYISLTNEHKDLVHQFFQKREAKTYIATDFNNKTFEKFNVESLPFSILIAPDGTIIWKGIPSSMNFKKMEDILKHNIYKPTHIKNKINTQKKSSEIKFIDNSKKLHSEHINSNFILIKDKLAFNKSSDCKKTNFAGSLKEIAASILEIPQENIQIETPAHLYGYFSVDTCISKYNQNMIFELLLKSFQIHYEYEELEKSVFELNIIDSTMLWSDELYEWSLDNLPSYIFGENFFQADNLSIKSLALQLSDLLGQEIIFLDNYNKIHDWNLNYSNFEELQLQLKNEYGISLQKRNFKTIKYILYSKKNRQ